MGDLLAAYDKDYRLPAKVRKVLEEEDVDEKIDMVVQLESILNRLPNALAMELSIGDDNSAVALLQLYLSYASQGVAKDRLARAGMTGYFGSITTAAVLEYQSNNSLTETGVYDRETREYMLDNNFELNLR